VDCHNVTRSYSTVGRDHPFACQQKLTQQWQHVFRCAYHWQQALCKRDGTGPNPDEGYAWRSEGKVSEPIALQTPICTLFGILPGPPVGIPHSVRAPLEPIKGRVRSIEHNFSQAL
jgi:hypothetical protein